MAINTTGIINFYTSITDTVVARYATMWANNQIDAETYAKLVGEASTQFAQIAADLIQKQEQLEVQNELLRQQALNEAQKILLTQQQVALAEKQVILAEKEILLKEQEIAIAQQELLLKAKEIDIAQQEILLKAKQIDVTEREIVDKELTNAKQRTLLDTQEQAEQYKVDNILPKEAALITLEGKGRYIENVIKDKEAAKLGLDNVVKNVEATRLTTPTAVYSPKYVEV